MTLLAFAADRRAAVIRIERRPRLLHTHRAAVDRYRLPAGPTAAANPPHPAAVDGCYRHADGRKRVL